MSYIECFSLPFDFSQPGAFKRRRALVDALDPKKGGDQRLYEEARADFERIARIVFTKDNLAAFNKEKLADVDRVSHLELQLPLELWGLKITMRNCFKSVTLDLRGDKAPLAKNSLQGPR